MKKYLKFKKCKDGHEVVECDGAALGCIEPRGQIFKKRVIYQDDIDSVEWTGECLIQLGHHLLEIEGKLQDDPQREKLEDLKITLEKWWLESAPDLTVRQINELKERLGAFCRKGGS